MIGIWIINIYITFILLIFSCKISTPIQNNNSVLIKLIFLYFIIIGTFATFTGDYLGYQEFINDVIIEKSNINMEPIYIWLVEITKGDINTFRFIIYFITFILLYYLLKITNNLDSRIIFIYATIELLTAIDGRQQISIYLFFIGNILIWKYRKYITGIFLVIICIFIHKSALYLFIGLPFIFIRFTKLKSILLLILFPFLTYLFIFIFNLITEQIDSNFIGSIYLNQEEESFLPTMTILLMTKPILIMTLSIWTIYKIKLDNAPLYIHYIYRWLYGIIYINCIISFLPIENYIIIYERFLRSQVIAIILILPYCIKPKLLNNIFFIILTFIIFFYMNSYIVLQVFRSR